jgi:hypothetical protein
VFRPKPYEQKHPTEYKYTYRDQYYEEYLFIPSKMLKVIKYLILHKITYEVDKHAPQYGT